MNETWFAIVALAVAAFLFKLAGLSIPPRILDNELMIRAVALIPVALLAALTFIQIFTTAKTVVLDARVVGLLVAAIALWFRLPFIVVVVAAAAAAAGIRAI